ncbi:MAG: SMC-Scp complex subunit ScpB [Actinomycetota bacterium]
MTDQQPPTELLPPSADPGAVDEPIPPAARRPGLEAVLFLADEPVEVSLLAELVDATPEEVEQELEDLARAHLAAGSGIEVRRAAGGWRLYTSQPAAPVVRRFALLGRTGRLTQAALETLAVIAYKQPITRQAISDIRGVNADGAVRSLAARGFVAEVGRDPGPGQAVLYGTTTLLLERLGLDSLDELPPLTEYLPEAPAPDEPDLDRLKDVRRRLAAGEDLPSLGGRTASQTNTGRGADRVDDDDVLPPPTPATPDHSDGPGIDELTDQLEAAARNAVGRLRAAVSAGDQRTVTEDQLQPSDDAPAPDAAAEDAAADDAAADDAPADAAHHDTAAADAADPDEEGEDPRG